MGYRKEFGDAYDMPDRLEILHRQGILEDQSWHNDAMPHSVMALRESTKTLRGVQAWLWWDAENQEDSEFAGLENWHRFVLFLTVLDEDNEPTGSDEVIICYTDSVNEVIAAITKLRELFGKEKAPEQIEECVRSWIADNPHQAGSMAVQAHAKWVGCDCYLQKEAIRQRDEHK